MRIGSVGFRLFWAWFDLWVGAYWSSKKRTLYLCLIPTVVLAIEFGRSNVMWKGMYKAVTGPLVGLGVRGTGEVDKNGIVTNFELKSVDIVKKASKMEIGHDVQGGGEDAKDTQRESGRDN